MRVFTKTDRISSGVKSSALARLNWVSLSLSLSTGKVSQGRVELHFFKSVQFCFLSIYVGQLQLTKSQSVVDYVLMCTHSYSPL